MGLLPVTDGPVIGQRVVRASPFAIVMLCVLCGDEKMGTNASPMIGCVGGSLHES